MRGSSHALLHQPLLLVLLLGAASVHEEHIGEGVKVAFYRSLATALGDAQVIILENEEPPEELKEAIAFTGFTKNRNVGRYGFGAWQE